MSDIVKQIKQPGSHQNAYLGSKAFYTLFKQHIQTQAVAWCSSNLQAARRGLHEAQHWREWHLPGV